MQNGKRANNVINLLNNKDMKNPIKRRTEITHIIHSKLLQFQKGVSDLKLLDVNLLALPKETIPMIQDNLSDLIELYDEYEIVQKEIDKLRI